MWKRSGSSKRRLLHCIWSQKQTVSISRAMVPSKGFVGCGQRRCWAVLTRKAACGCAAGGRGADAAPARPAPMVRHRGLPQPAVGSCRCMSAWSSATSAYVRRRRAPRRAVAADPAPTSQRHRSAHHGALAEYPPPVPRLIGSDTSYNPAEMRVHLTLATPNPGDSSSALSCSEILTGHQRVVSTVTMYFRQLDNITAQGLGRSIGHPVNTVMIGEELHKLWNDSFYYASADRVRLT